MRMVLSAIMILLWVGSAQAQVATNCATYDTTVLTAGTASALANCTINSGPYDTIFVMAVGEVTCGSVGDIALILVAGTGPAATPFGSLGANFHGSIAAGVLTITSMVTPYPEFDVITGQLLNDAQHGAGIPTSTYPGLGSSLTITGQLTSTESGGALGGRGTYSVSDAGVTVADELIWALNVGDPLGKPPASRQISRGPIEYLRCQDGTTGIISLVGSSPAAFAPNLQIWVAILISAEQIGSGNDIQSATWKNGQITMFSPGLSYFGGVLNGLGGAN